MKKSILSLFLLLPIFVDAQTACPSPLIKTSASSLLLGEVAQLEASGCSGLVLWYKQAPSNGVSPVEMGNHYYFSSSSLGTVRLYATCQSTICGVSAPSYVDLSILSGNVIASTTSDNYLKNSSLSSPTAAELGKYADIPISYNTGLPNISIPLTVLKGSQLSLSLSLSYHPSGNKVSQIASWVGLNWSLNAGGVISRQVMGGPDESWLGNKGEAPSVGDIASPVSNGFYADSGYSLPIFDGNTDNMNSSSNVSSYNAKRDKLESASRGYYDTEPDIFTFNVEGNAGKFYFDAQRVAHFVPEQDFKVEVVYTGNPSYEFDSFVLISPTGTRYYFGGSAYEKSSSTAGSSWGGSYLKSSWYLYKVESADREDVINLTYVDEAYSFYNLKDERYEMSTAASFIPVNPFTSYFTNHTSVEGKRLSQIQSKLMQVDFVANTLREDVGSLYYNRPNDVRLFSSPKRLDEIIVSSRSQATESTKYALNYGYYEAVLPPVGSFEYRIWTEVSLLEDSDKKRLKLLSVQEKSLDNSIEKPAYRFGYEGTALPRRLSFGQDHYGYSNGQINNQSFVDDVIISPRPNRSVNWSFMKAGHLTSIQYPTGASVSFEFEPHYDDTGASSYKGGLRLKSKTENDANGNSQVRNYSYGFGVYPYEISNYKYNFNLPLSNWQEFVSNWQTTIPPMPLLSKCEEAAITNTYLTLYSSNLYGSVASFLGSSPTYRRITVSEVGNGYSVFQYDYSYPKNFYNTYPYSSGELVNYVNNGKLISEEVYNQAGNLQEKTDYQYKVLPEANPINLVTAYHWEKIGVCQGTRNAFSKYSYPKTRSLLLEKKEISYDIDGTNPQEHIERYGYGNQHENYVRVSTEKSNTDSLVTERSLAKDYVVTGSLSGMAQRISELQARNINAEIENRQFIKKSGETAATMQAIGGSLNEFAVFSSNANLLKMSGVAALQVGEVPVSLSRSGIVSGIFTADNAYEKRANFVYNNAGLLASEALERGLSTTYTYQSNGLLSSKTLAGTQTISYNQSAYFGLQQLTDVSGKVQNFVYDKLGRFSYASLASNEITEKLRYVYSSSGSSCNVAAPVLSSTNTGLCEVTLSASGCGGTVTWNDGSVGNSLVVNTKTSTTYSATCSIPPCMSNSSNSLTIPILPNAWSSMDVGTPTAGCSQQNGSHLNLLGSGNLSSTDAFHYVYKELSGDFTMIAQVSSLQNVAGQRGGIMLRTSLTPTAIDYAIFQDGNTYVGLYRRETAGSANVFSGFQQASLNATWLKLVKTGSNLYAYFSTDTNPEANNAWLSTWSLVNGGSIPQNIAINSPFYLGLATWGNANLMTFSNITINGQPF
jgi:YD repeat-containing protein